MTIVGPTVDVLKIRVLTRNPTTTETKLAAQATTTNWVILARKLARRCSRNDDQCAGKQCSHKTQANQYSETEHEQEPEVQARNVHSSCRSQVGRKKIQDQAILHLNHEGDNQNDGSRSEKETDRVTASRSCQTALQANPRSG